MMRMSKYYHNAEDARNLYERCKRYFDSPIVKCVPLAELPEGLSCYGGLSAIARYSMLADNDFPTFAVTREEFRKLGIQQYKIQPRTETPVCLVHVLRYKLENAGAIDPISATLCIPKEEQEEPRMGNAMKEILEDVFY